MSLYQLNYVAELLN